MDASLPGSDEQDRILGDSRNAIKRHAFQMRKAIDDDTMREALRFSSAMLGELRTSQLSPQKYYELYMMTFDQLVILESFFGDERGKGRTYGELYELVQHAGNVLPRLYLMVAVGCLYIKSKEAKAKEILKDLVELCKGVQHPTRGLFLRSYLCQRSKGLLPDTGSPYEGEGGDVHDAIDFLLSNFIEMNKLWVRMQHQGNARDKDKREQERQQLQDLVGRNLTYLSQLDGLGYELYAQMVLPRVIEQIVSCKDGIAQQYLMQCVIQGFPDAFHLGTLDVLLAALPELQPEVKVHAVMSSLMDRLAKYAQTEAAVMQRLLDMKAFDKFRDSISRVLVAQVDMAAADKVEMFVALMNFTGSVLPNIVDNVNQVLAAAHQALSSSGLAGDSRAERHLVALLTIPLTKYDVVTGLGLTEYPLLMGLLRHRTHKDLAVKIIQTIVEGGTRISSVEKVAMLFRFICPLVKDVGDGPTCVDMDEEDVEEEQVLVARLLHSLYSEDPATHFQILCTAREQLVGGGTLRLRYTLPALGFCALGLVRRVALGRSGAAPTPAVAEPAVPAAPVAEEEAAGKVAVVDKEPLLEAEEGAGVEPLISPEPAAVDGGEGKGEGEEVAPPPAPAATEEAAAEAAEAAETAEAAAAAPVAVVTAEQLLQWVLQLCTLLAEIPQPMMALRLLLSAGFSSSEEAGLELLSYQFFEEAFTLYEEAISDQRHRLTALHSIIGTLHRCFVFGSENRDALVQNAAAYSARLLKRGDQCRAVCACSHLSWQDDPPSQSPSTGSRAQPPYPAVKDSTRVMASLKRAIKIANSAKQQVAASARNGDCTYVLLYIEILNHYLYYFDRGVEPFSASVLQPILDLIQGEMGSTVDASTTRYWARTLQQMSQQKVKAEGQLKAKYAALTIPQLPPLV